MIEELTKFTNTGKNRVFIFHHNDFDGYAGGAVLYNYFREELKFEDSQIVSKTIAYPTNDKTFIIDGVEPPTKEDFVAIVDYSITKDSKKYLNDIAELSFGTLWIDHHRTSLEVCYKTDCTSIGDNGLEARFYKIVNMDYSGALLAYRSLYKNRKVPGILTYVDDYDRFVHKYPLSAKFNAGFTAFETLKNIRCLEWTTLLSKNAKDVKRRELIEKTLLLSGTVVLKYDAQRYKELLNRIGYRVRIKDFPQYRVLVANTQGHSSVFGKRINDEDVDICLLYYYDGTKYCYHIYSTKSHIDVSEIAKHYGGGGHKGAAGFFSDQILFTKEGENQWTPLFSEAK